MSYMYYEVKKMIQEKYKKEFKQTGKGKISLALYCIGAVILISAVILSSLKTTENQIWIIGAFLIGLSFIIISIVMLIKIAASHNIKEHVLEVKRGIKDLGLNSDIKINKLKDEIIALNAKEDQQVQELIDAIKSIFKNLFWIPLGIILGFYINEENNFNIDVLLNFSVMLFLVTMIFIGVTIMIYPLLKGILSINRFSRDKVLRYLNDIEYLDER